MDKDTIKELCDLITAEVMKQVRMEISEMTPSLIDSITNTAASRATQAAKDSLNATSNPTLARLHDQIAALERRNAKLSSDLAKLSTTPQQSSPSFGSVQRPAATAVGGVNTLSPAELEDIRSYSHTHIETSQWIYYCKIVRKPKPGFEWANSFDEWGELYKVRPNGTENQKIFSGKVYIWPLWESLKLKGNRLCFTDIDRRERSIVV